MMTRVIAAAQARLFVIVVEQLMMMIVVIAVLQQRIHRITKISTNITRSAIPFIVIGI